MVVIIAVITLKKSYKVPGEAGFGFLGCSAVCFVSIDEELLPR